jgi:hypothetical protein
MDKTIKSPMDYLGLEQDEVVTINGKDFMAIASVKDYDKLRDLKTVANRIHKGDVIFPVFELEE